MILGIFYPTYFVVLYLRAITRVELWLKKAEEAY
jgi:hypothetical protein